MKSRDQALQLLRNIDDALFARVGKPKILFVVANGYGFACQAPVIRKLLDTGNVSVRVATDRHMDLTHVHFDTDADKELFLRLHMDRRFAEWRKWHIAVYSHLCNFYPRRRALKAYLHHGPGFGSGGGINAAKACDIYLGLSKAEFDYIEQESPGLFGSHKAFFPVGFPKSDVLFKEDHSRAAILRELGLPDRKTMLIASKWNPGSLLRALGHEVFARLAAAYPDWTVIQTGHPWLWQPRTDIDSAWQTNLKNELEQVTRRFANARFLPRVAAEPLAAIADLLVADGTSVATLFGLLNKPIVFFDNPALDENQKRAVAAYREASHVFGTAAEVVDCTRTALVDPEEKHLGRENLQHLYYSNVGLSSEVTATVLSAIGKVCSVESDGWSRVVELSRALLAECSQHDR